MESKFQVTRHLNSQHIGKLILSQIAIPRIVLCKRDLQIESYAPKWFWIALLLHGHCMYCLAFFQLRISWDNKSITKYFQVIMNEIVEKYNFFQIFSCHSSLPGNILASLIKSLYSSPFEKVIVTTKWTKHKWFWTEQITLY